MTARLTLLCLLCCTACDNNTPVKFDTASRHEDASGEEEQFRCSVTQPDAELKTYLGEDGRTHWAIAFSPATHKRMYEQKTRFNGEWVDNSLRELSCAVDDRLKRAGVCAGQHWAYAAQKGQLVATTGEALALGSCY